MNEPVITEYVELCARLTALDAETEHRLYACLDQLWYAEMTAADRAEAARRLGVLGEKTLARHDARSAEGG